MLTVSPAVTATRARRERLDLAVDRAGTDSPDYQVNIAYRRGIIMVSRMYIDYERMSLETRFIHKTRQRLDIIFLPPVFLADSKLRTAPDGRAFNLEMWINLILTIKTVDLSVSAQVLMFLRC